MSCWFYIAGLTFEKISLIFIVLSTPLSIDSLITGEKFSNDSSSLSSHKRRDFAYANIISWLGCGVAGRQTVAFAENSNSRDEL
jgi:hypothetical protein